jgi:hypothetical protein
MKDYQAAITAHLSRYAKRRLGVFETGTYKGRHYAHILPPHLRFLNLLEPVRAELQDYLHANPAITLHQYFHHLNSSQAFAFNLFYPYFSSGVEVAGALTGALGLRSNISAWEFEHVSDRAEGTNVDVMWRAANGTITFCEVKLSETGFGTAHDDAPHRKKLDGIYRPRLKGAISSEFLDETNFFRNYQLLRNISLLAESPGHRLVILLPRENEMLAPSLQLVLAALESKIRGQILMVYIEDCIEALKNDTILAPEFRIYASSLAEKYIPFPALL